MGFSRVITTTTRSPREGEVNGVHYHFFSAEEFDTRAARGEFLEWAWVHGRKRYGTLKSSVVAPLKDGRDLVMSVDVQGVDSIRRAADSDPALGRALVTVFIVVDYERLLARMRSRGQDDEEEIARRMHTAETELREAHKFDHQITSRTRDEDFAELVSIVNETRWARA